MKWHTDWNPLAYAKPPPNKQTCGFLGKHKQTGGMTQIRTRSILMAGLSWFFFMHGVPLVPGLSMTHTAGTRLKMLLGACSACLAGFVSCLALGQPPHAEPQCHITQTFPPKLSSHQSDATSPKAISIHLNPRPTPCHPNIYTAEDPSNKQTKILKNPPHSPAWR